MSAPEGLDEVDLLFLFAGPTNRSNRRKSSGLNNNEASNIVVNRCLPYKYSVVRVVCE